MLGNAGSYGRRFGEALPRSGRTGDDPVDDHADLLERLCATCAASLPVSDVAISLMPSSDVRGPVVASSELGVRIDDPQWTLGEGPCIEAVGTGRPVLVPDIEPVTRQRRWPLFAAGALAAGVRAVFALPMVLGVITIGVVELYRDRPGPLPRTLLREALVAADGMALLMLGPCEGGCDASDVAWTGRAEVHQATGMVMAQLGVAADEALIWLRAFAFAQGRVVTDVAREVIARRMRFNRDDL
ncbi:MAG: GAF and ANTAR domain-containing protein [Pseudonocardia sp.]|nr:GAF and ANTAR domain-containing protein [Pseudonocardia sp.]